MNLSELSLLVALGTTGGIALPISADVPVPFRTTEHRYHAVVDESATVVQGDLAQIRIEHRDRLGRLFRWEERTASGAAQLIWVATYADEGMAPGRAAYWSDDTLVPSTELVVSSGDGRVQDIYHSDHGEKPRRQIRQYLDASGREIYQEYFAPRTQRKYSEEIFQYDARGNELARTWRRLDGAAVRESRFQVIESNQYGHWTRRVLHVNGAPTELHERSVEYGRLTRPHPPASAGPVESLPLILPAPFAPGVITTNDLGENSLTFMPDGRGILFTRYGEDWNQQQALMSMWRDGAWREPEPLLFTGQVYNAALSEDGEHMIYCRQDGSQLGARVFISTRSSVGWSAPIDLTERAGLRGSYFRLCADGTLLYHLDGDLYTCRLDASGVGEVEALPAPINTPDGVEFAAWTDVGGRRVIFTRGHSDPERSGVFVTTRKDGEWTLPTRLPIPYGWGVVISPDGEDLVYVVDDDIVRVPVALLTDSLPRLDESR